jgi:transposase
LVSSYNTDKGPRQKTLINIGQLPDFSLEERKLLGKRLEELLLGKPNLIPFDDKIEEKSELLYSKYKASLENARLLEAQEVLQEEKPRAEILYNEIENSESKSIGEEYICNSIYEKLELETLFVDVLNFTTHEAKVAKLLILGKVIHPTSELGTYRWIKGNTGLSYITDEDYQKIGLNILYKVLNKIYLHKDLIEEILAQKEQTLFSRDDSVLLYDLTNTYFEGSAAANENALRGRSKEKRKDCKLLTLGLLVDNDGFIKSSFYHPGNQSETSTLEEILNANDKNCKSKEKPPIIMDAGIASEENIELLKQKDFNYIVVKRSNKVGVDITNLDYKIIRENEQESIKIEGGIVDKDDELFLVCKSNKKELKEKSMLDKFEALLTSNLTTLNKSIENGNIKDESKIDKKIGRLIEKYKSVAYCFDIKTIKTKKKVTKITWEKNKNYSKKNDNLGNYVLRTNMKNMSEQEIWETYNLIRKIENSFRVLKSDLRLRPIHHQKKNHQMLIYFYRFLVIIYCI